MLYCKLRIYWVGVNPQITIVVSYWKFCIDTHPINSKFRIWQVQQCALAIKIHTDEVDKFEWQRLDIGHFAINDLRHRLWTATNFDPSSAHAYDFSAAELINTLQLSKYTTNRPKFFLYLFDFSETFLFWSMNWVLLKKTRGPQALTVTWVSET